MKRVFLAFLAIVISICTPAARAADLPEDIAAVLGDRLLSRASVGITVVKLGASAEASTVIYQKDAETPLVPASNLKLATTSAALDKLGPEFRFRTLLVKHGDDLVLVGDGDPTLGDAELLTKVGWKVTTVFENWAEALRKRGITRAANVLVDDSVFEENGLHKHWPADQLQLRYCAEVGGANLNANCVDFYLSTSGDGNLVAFRTNPATDYLTVKNACLGGGDNAVWLARQPLSNNVTLAGTCPRSNSVPVSVTVHDPSLFAATVLAETLKANGITITGKPGRDRTVRAALRALAAPAPTTAASQATSEWQVLAAHETPLAQVLARANKDSMNLYAECLCKRLGFAASGESGSWENGTTAVGAFLKRAGVTDTEFHLDDGCGLSKMNNISPNALAHVLMYDYVGPNRAAFMASLSVAGSDGTLQTRFAASDLRGRVLGKSGYVKGVSALSGFLHAKDDHWYAFSILMNGVPDGSNSGIKPLQEAIVRSVDQHAGKGVEDKGSK